MVYSHGIGIQEDAKHRGLTLGVIASVILAVALSITTFAATPSTSYVTPSNWQGWEVDSSGATATFVDDLSAPGDAALQMSVDSSNSSYVDVTKQVNLDLDKVQTLSFMTKTIGGPEYASGSLAVGIDTDGNGVTNNYYSFEPYWQNGESPDAAPVVKDQWQTWNVLGGILWDSGGGAPFYTWEKIKTANPNARLSAVAIYLGSDNPGFKVNFDNVVINEVTYDFEKTAPDTQVTNKDQCKKDGWKNAVDKNGNTFKNQGQCVSSVASNKNNQ